MDNQDPIDPIENGCFNQNKINFMIALIASNLDLDSINNIKKYVIYQLQFDKFT